MYFIFLKLFYLSDAKPQALTRTHAHGTPTRGHTHTEAAPRRLLRERGRRRGEETPPDKFLLCWAVVFVVALFINLRFCACKLYFFALSSRP